MTVQTSIDFGDPNLKTSIMITTAQKSWLNQEAESKGCSQTAIIRELIDEARQRITPSSSDGLSVANLSVCAHDWAVAQLTLQLNTRAYNFAIGGHKVVTTNRYDPSDIIVLNEHDKPCLHIEVKTECRQKDWGYVRNLNRNIEHVEGHIEKGRINCPILLVQCHILKRKNESGIDILRAITDAAPDYSLIHSRATKWSAVLWPSPNRKYWLIGETLTEITKIMHNGVDQFIESVQQLWQDCA